LSLPWPPTSKSSAELKAELTFIVYGINPKSFAVERVTVSRGQVITYFRKGRSPSAYRIKGGRPARLEIPRVFKLTNLIWLPPHEVAKDGAIDPLLASLIDTARAQQRAAAGDEST
jgi:hypothetical protein